MIITNSNYASIFWKTEIHGKREERIWNVVKRIHLDKLEKIVIQGVELKGPNKSKKK